MVPFIGFRTYITFSLIPWQGVDVKRVQFPVRLCFAVTVHRSQGQTLNRVVFIYAGMFSCTDACMSVYLSRVRKSADIRILATEDRICPYTLCANFSRLSTLFTLL